MSNQPGLVNLWRTARTVASGRDSRAEVIARGKRERVATSPTDKRRKRSGDTLQALSLKLRAATRDRFKSMANKRGVTLGELLDQALDALEQARA